MANGTAKRTKPRRNRRIVGLDDATVALAVTAARFGATDVEIARSVGIGHDTLYRWYREFPALSEAVKEAKATFDERIERALAHRALGYSHPETKTFYDKDVGVIEHTVIKHYPPDTGAAIIWLKNRQPHRWSDVHKVEGRIQHEHMVDDKALAMAVLNIMQQGLTAATTEPVDVTPAPTIEHASAAGDASERPVRAEQGPDGGGDVAGEDVAPAARRRR